MSRPAGVYCRVLDQVQADVDQIGLGADGVTLDCDRFAELYARGDWPGAAALVEGDFLEGLSIPDASQFEDWLGGERVRWRAQSVDALIRYADGLLARGDPAAARPRPVLCGRGSELAALAAAWERAKSGRGQVIIVEGEPGEGKSRLIEELVARARLDDATVAAARAVAVDQRKDWSAVAGLLAAGLAAAPRHA